MKQQFNSYCICLLIVSLLLTACNGATTPTVAPSIAASTNTITASPSATTTATFTPTSTETSTPTSTSTATSTKTPSPTATRTKVPPTRVPVTQKPPTAIPTQTLSVSSNNPFYTGSFDGCPVLYPGQQFTRAYFGDPQYAGQDLIWKTLGDLGVKRFIVTSVNVVMDASGNVASAIITLNDGRSFDLYSLDFSGVKKLNDRLKDHYDDGIVIVEFRGVDRYKVLQAINPGVHVLYGDGSFSNRLVWVSVWCG